MKNEAVEILDANRTMAISTIRPDGWPQTTIVGYANEGFSLYFVIFRESQKFANIASEPRVSLAVGQEPADLRDAKAIYAGALAAEVINPVERDRAWQVLVDRHPNLAEVAPADMPQAALMHADCKHVSVVDYSKGLGHSEAIEIPIVDEPEGKRQ